jgi:hypothetical protein
MYAESNFADLKFSRTFPSLHVFLPDASELEGMS